MSEYCPFPTRGIPGSFIRPQTFIALMVFWSTCSVPTWAWQVETPFTQTVITQWSPFESLNDFRPGRVDADPFPDLVIITNFTSGFQARVAYGDGKGGFGEFTDLGPVFERVTGYQWADFDGNGILDLAVSHVDTFEVLMNPGVTGTRFSHDLPDGNSILMVGPVIWAGDGDGDGDDDLFMFTIDSSGSGLPVSPVIAVLLDGNGQIDHFEVHPDQGMGSSSIGHFNEDNLADLWLNGDRVLLSRAGASYQLVDLDLIGRPNIDLNGDGLVDILEVNGSLSMVSWNENGSWGDERFIRIALQHASGAVDFNGDGKVDIYGKTPDSRPGVQFAADGLTFGDAVVLDDGRPTLMDHADFDQDGTADLLTVDIYTALAIVYLNGSQTAPPQIVDFGLTPETIATGDETQISWSVEGADRVSLSPGIGEVEAMGTLMVRKSRSTRYTLTAENEVGVVSQQRWLSVIAAPDFITSDNYWLDELGGLICFYPDPGIDGTPGDLTYRVSFYQGCEPLSEPTIVDAGSGWPVTLSLPASELPEGAYQIGVSRVPVEQTDLSTVESIEDGPRALEPPNTDSGPEAFSRWLPHIPKSAGGFAAEIKIVNRNTLATANLTFWAFDRDGALLAVEERRVDPATVRYHGIYQGNDPLFSAFPDAVSHIAIFEESGATSVSLRYISEASGFGAWTEEVDLSSGTVLASGFGIEARGSEDSADGLAILNLISGREIAVRAQQVDRAGNSLDEVMLGTIPDGGKRLFVLSDLFPFRADTAYRIESLDGASFQVTALVFSESAFFTTTTVDQR